MMEQRGSERIVKAGDQKDQNEGKIPESLAETPENNNSGKTVAPSEITQEKKESEVKSLNGDIPVAAGECVTLSKNKVESDKQPSANEDDISQKSNKSLNQVVILEEKTTPQLREVGSPGLMIDRDSVPGEMDEIEAVRKSEDAFEFGLNDLGSEMPASLEDIMDMNEEFLTLRKELCERKEHVFSERKLHSHPTKFSAESDKNSQRTHGALSNLLKQIFLEIECSKDQESFVKDGKQHLSNLKHNNHTNLDEPHAVDMQSKSTMTDPIEGASDANKLSPSKHLGRISKQIENAEQVANITVEKLKSNFQTITVNIISMIEELGDAVNDLIQDVATNVTPFDDSLPQQTYVLFDRLWHSLCQEVEELKQLAEYLRTSNDKDSAN